MFESNLIDQPIMEELHCPFTKQNVSSTAQSTSSTGPRGSYNYGIIVNGHVFDFTVPKNALLGQWNKDDWFVRYGHLVQSSLWKGLRIFDEDEFVTLDVVKHRVTSLLPIHPKQRLDYLIKAIDALSRCNGELITYHSIYHRTTVRLRPIDVYMKEIDELQFYISSLESENLVESTGAGGGQREVKVTYAGLNYIAQIDTEGFTSKKCFIAMAFAEERRPFREAIVQAVEAEGFEAVIIDNRHLPSDKTINDQIIAEIRRCRFCISDFSLQKNGVYFEAGFALGLGKPVIYVCEKEDFFVNSHFDLKPFQHILYDTAQELETGLRNKIAAWIK